MRLMPYLAVIMSLALLFVGCPPPNEGCLDFQAMTEFPKEFPGPTFSLNWLNFTNPTDRNGNPVALWIGDRSEDQDGKAEMNIPYSYESNGYKPLIVDFSGHYKHGVRRVTVELRHFYGAKVIALDAANQEVAEATCDGENIRRELLLESNSIMKIKFHAVETLVYKICWKEN